MEKLKYMPYAQAQIIRGSKGTIVLRSYSTNVAYIFTDGTIACTGLYSATTRRHISAFARQFGYTYYDFKAAYERR